MQPSRARRVARRVGGVARKVGRKARHVAAKHGASGAVLMGAAGLGYAQAKGYLNKIPTVGGSRALTLALAGYALTRLSSNATARQIGSTAMVIGAFDWGAKQGGGKSALEGADSSWMDGDDEI
jgi:hypothetical protein